MLASNWSAALSLDMFFLSKWTRAFLSTRRLTILRTSSKIWEPYFLPKLLCILYAEPGIPTTKNYDYKICYMGSKKLIENWRNFWAVFYLGCCFRLFPLFAPYTFSSISLYQLKLILQKLQLWTVFRDRVDWSFQNSLIGNGRGAKYTLITLPILPADKTAKLFFCYILFLSLVISPF